MTRTTIGPDENLRLRFSVPKDHIIKFEIDADHPVKSYIVRQRGLELFDDGSKSFKYYGGFPEARREQEQELILPFDGHWYLIIMNPDRNREVEVHYEVYY